MASIGIQKEKRFPPPMNHMEKKNKDTQCVEEIQKRNKIVLVATKLLDSFSLLLLAECDRGGVFCGIIAQPLRERSRERKEDRETLVSPAPTSDCLIQGALLPINGHRIRNTLGDKQTGQT